MDKTTTPCAACKHLRRKCTKECVFAPYFSTEKQENYEAVHKVFGASHVARIIDGIHPSQREAAMDTLAWEARVRLSDPVNGCTTIINSLHLKLKQVEDELTIAKKELASYGIVPTFMPPPPIAYQQSHRYPIMSATPNNDGYSVAQQLQGQTDRFTSTQIAQIQHMQQIQETQETQTHYNGSMKMVRDKKS